MSTPWDPTYKRKSKTYTSSEVKERYNVNHYDRICFRAGKGSAEAVKLMAELRGMSVAAYLRHLIIQDCEDAGKPEISRILGGGGDITKLSRLLGITPQEIISLQRDALAGGSCPP